MADLSVEYLGLKLKNPIIVGSSTLTDSMDNIFLAEKYGAAAIVLKSLYEEELRDTHGDFGDGFHPEAYAYEMYEADMLYGSGAYVQFIEEVKSKVNIPVIASISCEGGKYWTKYAEKLEKAGADAIELNISFLSFDPQTKAAQIVPKYEEVISAVREVVNIPIAAKIGQNFSSLPGVVRRLNEAGADSVVLFNRYFQMGIDLDCLKPIPVNLYSTPAETYNVLRWVGVITPQLPNVQLCSSTGIHSEKEIIQHLMAGASAVQMVSALYLYGFRHIEGVLKRMNKWMDEKGYESIADIKCKLCQGDTEALKKLQRFFYNKVTRGHFDFSQDPTASDIDELTAMLGDYGI